MKSAFFALCACLLFFAPIGSPLVAQTDSSSQYLMVGSGLNINSYHSLGTRIFFDYSKHFSTHWLWSVSFEHARSFNKGFTAQQDAPSMEVSHNILSGNIYRKVYWSAKNTTHWQFGAGLGLAHAFWNQNDRIGLAVNFSAGLHIKVAPRMWITTSAVPFLLPTNRITYSHLRIDGFPDFISGSFLNLGFQARL